MILSNQELTREEKFPTDVRRGIGFVLLLFRRYILFIILYAHPDADKGRPRLLFTLYPSGFFSPGRKYDFSLFLRARKKKWILCHRHSGSKAADSKFRRIFRMSRNFRRENEGIQGERELYVYRPNWVFGADGNKKRRLFGTKDDGKFNFGFSLYFFFVSSTPIA